MNWEKFILRILIGVGKLANKELDKFSIDEQSALIPKTSNQEKADIIGIAEKMLLDSSLPAAKRSFITGVISFYKANGHISYSQFKNLKNTVLK